MTNGNVLRDHRAEVTKARPFAFPLRVEQRAEPPYHQIQDITGALGQAQPNELLAWWSAWIDLAERGEIEP